MRRFCAPATLVPAAVTPAVLLGPTMTVTLTTGSCSVAKDANATGALLATCQPPTITWVKVRMVLTFLHSAGALRDDHMHSGSAREPVSRRAVMYEWPMGSPAGHQTCRAQTMLDHGE